MSKQKVNDLENAKLSKSKKELTDYMLTGAERGDVDLVRYCLSAGADPTAARRFARNALHITAEMGETKIAELLIDAGVDINAPTFHSYTPLHLACNTNHHEFAVMLLDHGANVDTRDKLGRTALHYAVGKRDLKMAHTVIKYGANVNAMDNLQNTPLSLAAVDSPSVGLVQLLLKSAADPNAERRLCIPIFIDCVMNVNEKIDSTQTYKILQLLLDHGADANVVDRATQKNALHFAALGGALQLAVFLVQHGTNPFHKDVLGRIPLDIARQFHHSNMVLWLEDLKKRRERISELTFKSTDLYI